MADQWYYRMFGQDFGPVELDDLKQLAELGSIAVTDEVRRTSSTSWVQAGSVGEIGLGSPVSSSVGQAPVIAAVTPNGSTALNTSDWYCKLHGQELGPLSFEELIGFAEQGQLAANDDVRLGATGKWRRVGSIGRMVAVLPYSEMQVSNPKPPEKAPPPAAPAVAKSVPVLVHANNPAVAVAQTALAQAQTAYATADQSAKMQVAWALAPNIDPAWWGWIGGAEYGPAGFVQIYEWANSGRLQPTDFIKNGMYGQYVPAASVPGLFTAVAILTQAREAMRVAQEVLTSIPSAPNPVPVPIPTPVSPIAAPSKSVESPKPAEEKKTIVAAASGQPAPVSVAAKPEIVAAPIAKVEEPAKPAVVSSAPPTTGSSVSQLSISSGSMAAPTSGVSRPLPTPARPSTPPRPSSGGSALEFVKDPKFLGGVGAVALLVLAGWFLLSFKNAARDIERLRELKQLLADVRSARTSGTTNFETLITRAKKITEEFTAAYKVAASNDYPAKQALFWAARDELPKLMSGDLTKESTSEKNLELRLKDASAMLGVK